MGIRVIVGSEEGNEGPVRDRAVLFDSVTNLPLPTTVFEEHPTMSAEDQANGFLAYLEESTLDPRACTPAQLGEWRSKFVAEHGLY